MTVPAVILAGGRASRMGGADKCLVTLDGEPILARIVRALAPQTSGILLNANGDPARFAKWCLPVRGDILPGFEGPLSGLLTGLLWAREQFPQASHVLSVAGDMPFLPHDLHLRLTESLACARADIAVACDTERLHPVVGLWPVASAGQLRCFLRETHIRSVHAWLEEQNVVRCRFARHVFANINTWHDLENARRTAAAERKATASPVPA